MFDWFSMLLSIIIFFIILVFVFVFFQYIQPRIINYIINDNCVKVVIFKCLQIFHINFDNIVSVKTITISQSFDYIFVLRYWNRFWPEEFGINTKKKMVFFS